MPAGRFVVTGSMREAAIAGYHASLATDETLTPEFLAELKAKMRARRLVYGARELGVALRPHFLTSAQYAALRFASETVAGALQKVEAALLADQSLLGLIGLREKEHHLALADPGFTRTAVTARLDAFVYGDSIKFVEYNAENPSSLTDQDGLNQVLFETRALQSMSAQFRLRQFTPLQSLLEALCVTFREWSGQPRATPNIAIVDWENLPTASEFELARNYFVGCGVPTVICAPNELEYMNGQLRCGPFRIDLVYKRLVIHEFLARHDETHPLARAYLNGHVCLANPFRCKILQKKAVFEFLTDEKYSAWFNSAEQDVTRRSVPWTRRLTGRRTHYQGREFDLLKLVREERERFVLKPNDDYGGRGVSFGKDASAAAWDTTIANATDQDFIVQEIVELQTEEFPVFDGQKWSFQPMFVDVNPFLFHGKVDGAFVRLSDSPVVNVSSNGGETGFFVIEGAVN